MDGEEPEWSQVFQVPEVAEEDEWWEKREQVDQPEKKEREK